MTISEHFEIDDLLAVCLHFAEVNKLSLGNISKHDLDLFLFVCRIYSTSPECPSWCATNVHLSWDFTAAVSSVLPMRIQTYGLSPQSGRRYLQQNQCLFLRLWGLVTANVWCSCRANGTFLTADLRISVFLTVSSDVIKHMSVNTLEDDKPFSSLHVITMEIWLSA